jgi:hypothetical protein
MVAAAAVMWSGYGNTHADTFANANLEKFVITNAEGAIVARNSKVAELVKSDLYTNSSALRHEDFLVIQSMINEVRRRKLNGIADLQGAGLSFSVGIEEQLIGNENINEFQEANQEMNPTDYQDNDTVFSEMYTPNPITHQSFSVPWRQTGFDYKRSAGLKENIRQVAERLEETLFNGNDKIKVSFGGEVQSIYGYTNHPDRGTATISDWANTANNDLIVNEVIANVNKMFTDQGGVETGSVVLYYPKNFKASLDRDYKAGFPSKTVRDRIMDIPEIKDVKYAEKLADSNVIYVEMADRTIQLAVATDIVAIPHSKTNPMENQVISTYAAMVQIIKVDSAGNTGILHATVA